MRLTLDSLRELQVGLCAIDGRSLVQQRKKDFSLDMHAYANDFSR
jgi:hypothetical protein